MDNLENMLLILSARIVSGNESLNKISGDIKILASAYHYAEGDEPLTEMNREWIRKWGNLLYKKEG